MVIEQYLTDEGPDTDLARPLASKHLSGLEKQQVLLQMSRTPALKQLPMGFKLYMQKRMRHEKFTKVGDRVFVNSHLPPFPSKAFDRLFENLRAATTEGSRLQSAYLAVTNRCPCRCWHCSNAYRHGEDFDPVRLKAVLTELQDMGVIVIGLSGGEPLLRHDLPELIAHIDDRTIKEIFTTGIGLTVERAKALRAAGLDTIIISLDHLNPKKHDRMRRRTGAFHRAVDALVLGVQMGFYTVVSTVADRPFLFSSTIWKFLEFLGGLGVHEVRLLEPKPAGRLILGEFGAYGEREKQRLREIHIEANSSKTLPSIAAFAYVACGMNMGCVGGTTHLFIDNQGNVCTCDLLPLSYGNVFKEPLQAIIVRMREHHRNPRRTCLLPPLQPYIIDKFDGELPLPYEKSVEVMKHAPDEEMPGFFHKLNCLER